MSYSYADVHNMTAYPSKLIANKIIDSTSDQAYYILASLSEDKSDFEDSTLDVRATDGKCCWCKEGLQRQPAPKDWMVHVYAALSGSSKDGYEIQVQSSSSELKVIVRWHEAKIRVRATVALPAANGDALPSMLSTLFDSFGAMQRAHAELADLEASFKGRAESSQAALEKLVESKEKREQDLYVKFAAVVNEKKRKLRELQQRITELEEQAEEGPDLEEISAPGSPARDRAADGEGDSIYDADTAPSAGGSGTPSEDSEDGDNEATQRAPGAGTDTIALLLEDADAASEGPAGENDRIQEAQEARLQAERDALLAAETQPMEPEQDADEDMQDAPGEPTAAPEQPAPAAKPPSKPGGLAKRRRR